MKILHIALKDLLRAYRSVFAVAMMFVAPLLITGFFSAAFGGLAGASNEPSLPRTQVTIINRDQTQNEQGLNAGALLARTLESEELAALFEVTYSADAATARAAVDLQQFDAAVIIPESLSRAIFARAAGPLRVEVYHDPTLLVGPGVAEAVLDGFVDGFAGARVTLDVVTSMLENRGMTLAPIDQRKILETYTGWLGMAGGTRGAESTPVFTVRGPVGQKIAAADVSGPTGTAIFIGPIMLAMTALFMFYTGTAGALSILREEEDGTLARMLITPTPRTAVLGGKILAVLLTVLVQGIVLMSAATLFGIRWHNGLLAATAVVSVSVAAGGLGLFVLSLVKTTKQAGPIIGVVMSVGGMASGLFTTGIQNLPKPLQTAALFVPHGWAMKILRGAAEGAGMEAVAIPALVLLGMGICFFLLGTMIFRKRIG